MRRIGFALLGALALASVLAAASTAIAREDDNRRRQGRTILEFDTMTPVVAPFTGNAHPIRGVPGGGLPWAIARGEGELKADGRLEVEVRGLVLAAGPAIGTTGAVAAFTATVNCLTTASPDTGRTLSPSAPVNVGANGPGNAEIRAQFNLPHPCVAPIVFVGTGNDLASFRWFATTGN